MTRSLRHTAVRGLAFASACALLGACDSPTVPPRVSAYEFTYEGFGERLIYRWPDGERIGVYVVPDADPERRAVLEAAVRHTMDVWNDAILYGEYRIELAPLERADVVVAWANTLLPIDVSDCPPSGIGSSWTTFCTDTTIDLSEVAESDTPVEGISGYPLLEGEHAEDGVHMIVQVIDDPLNVGLVPALIAHEFGHVLGIGTHPCHAGEGFCTGEIGRRQGTHASLMFEGVPERADPSSSDRETIQLLYHVVPHLTP